ncbi:Ypt/Rab-specific GTPase-activating protein GYP1 [Forsythia ovata]|uniref:Ypt/Rab-specific GTPase-activating protein GYP1 n=1 Tax=Forsythia ovata TaxID=205694 RepID=A0ABD1UZS3_9LAMI
MSMRSNSSSNYYNKEDDRNKDASSSPSTLDSKFNQTLRNVQGLLKGRSFPGKVLITQRSDPLDQSALQSPNNNIKFSNSDAEQREQFDRSVEFGIFGPCGLAFRVWTKIESTQQYDDRVSNL